VSSEQHVTKHGAVTSSQSIRMDSCDPESAKSHTPVGTSPFRSLLSSRSCRNFVNAVSVLGIDPERKLALSCMLSRFSKLPKAAGTGPDNAFP
jgi:hypothetical protein